MRGFGFLHRHQGFNNALILRGRFNDIARCRVEIGLGLHHASQGSIESDIHAAIIAAYTRGGVKTDRAG